MSAFCLQYINVSFIRVTRGAHWFTTSCSSASRIWSGISRPDLTVSQLQQPSQFLLDSGTCIPRKAWPASWSYLELQPWTRMWGRWRNPKMAFPALSVLQHKSFLGGTQGLAFLNLKGAGPRGWNDQQNGSDLHGTQSPEELDDDPLLTKGILQPVWLRLFFFGISLSMSTLRRLKKTAPTAPATIWFPWRDTSLIRWSLHPSTSQPAFTLTSRRRRRLQ